MSTKPIDLRPTDKDVEYLAEYLHAWSTGGLIPWETDSDAWSYRDIAKRGLEHTMKRIMSDERIVSFAGAALIAEGGETKDIRLHGTQMLWRCRNCGGDHGDAGCDDPDLFDYNTFRIDDGIEPGRYLVFPIPAEEETTT